MRKRTLSSKSRKKIAEKLKNRDEFVAKETDLARQARIDELSESIIGQIERPPARGGPPSVPFVNSKSLASSSRGLRRDITGNTMVQERGN